MCAFTLSAVFSQSALQLRLRPRRSRLLTASLRALSKCTFPIVFQVMSRVMHKKDRAVCKRQPRATLQRATGNAALAATRTRPGPSHKLQATLPRWLALFLPEATQMSGPFDRQMRSPRVDTPSPYRTSSYPLTIRQIPTRPNKTITPRSTGAGSRLPTLAPIDPPTSDPAAINPAASQLIRQRVEALE